jgi:hypothetical protein
VAKTNPSVLFPIWFVNASTTSIGIGISRMDFFDFGAGLSRLCRVPQPHAVRSGTVGIWQRSPSPEHDDLRLCRRRRLGEGCRTPREHKRQGDSSEHLTFANVTHAGEPQKLYLRFSWGAYP